MLKRAIWSNCEEWVLTSKLSLSILKLYRFLYFDPHPKYLSDFFRISFVDIFIIQVLRRFNVILVNEYNYDHFK